ncbi:3-oxo-tetronate 4-phosphate decarboxylase [Rubritepida flocculans]|uniref:3-oxo-tetronate 4-phosphate decarboxylase n=1 Tax=Rubritepida flocculans TaxID=182403 RepID=UPI00042851A7|nr:aldolase [Rubritepida flocculans]
MSEEALREELVALGASLFQRGFSVGSAGNISVRLPDGYLMTPTNSCLGRLEAARISKLDLAWNHVGGDRPTKEVFLHRAFLEARPDAGAVVHLHSTHATALSCLDGAIPPLTPYFVMRAGREVPLIPYYRPGDAAMEPAIREAARRAKAVLLANHGPVICGPSLTDAVNAAEELEEAAKLALLLRGANPRLLTPAQVDDLLRTFG